MVPTALTVKRSVLFAASLALMPAAWMAASAPAKPAGSAPVPIGSSMQAGAIARAQSLAFIENRGQWDAQAQFLARAPGADVWLTETGVVYDFYRLESTGSLETASGPDKKANARRRGHAVRMEFLDSAPNRLRGENELEGYLNYFMGNDPDRWTSRVPRYSEAWAERVYDGVEARWYFDQGSPRFDLIVAPGADPSKITMRFEGAARLTTTGRSLGIETSIGNAELRGLFAYQKVNGATRQVPCSFEVKGREVQFNVGQYDRTLPLVIDPIIWATLVGGLGSEIAYAADLDNTGRAVVVGVTDSGSFPVTVGAYDTAVNGVDCAVAKTNASGTQLVFATYLGGTASDQAFDVDLDAANNILITGVTGSVNFPTTVGAFDTTVGGLDDAFYARLSADGTTLSASTYLGGAAQEFGYGISSTPTNGVVIVGSTASADFPTIGGAFDTTSNGSSDGFVTFMDGTAATMTASTYLGGTGFDSAERVVFYLGEAYICGYTNSADFPTTLGAYDESSNGVNDAFVAKLSTSCALLESTLIGTESSDVATSIAVGDEGGLTRVFVCGNTAGMFPTTAGAFQTTPSGSNDGFVAKFDSGLTTLVRASLIGGSAADVFRDIARDADGNIVVVGESTSTNFPVTPGAFSTISLGGVDATVTKFDAELAEIFYSTYMGGATTDRAYSVSLDLNKNAVVAGTTGSPNFPVTAGAFDTTLGAPNDMYVMNVATMPIVVEASFPKSSVVGGFAAQLSLTISQVAGPSGIDVSLTTNNPGKVFVAPTIKVKDGKMTRNYGVRTETVKVDTPVTVTVSCSGLSKTLNLTLKPGGLQSVKVNPNAISSFQLGSGTVLLSAAAPAGGRRVELDSSRPDLVFVPTDVDVEEGFESAVFPTFAGVVGTSTNVTVAARLGSMTRTATLAVSP